MMLLVPQQDMHLPVYEKHSTQDTTHNERSQNNGENNEGIVACNNKLLLLLVNSKG